MSHSFSTEMIEQALRDRLDTLTGFGSEESKARKLVEVFKKVDTNGSGAVDHHEFEAAMAELNFQDVPGIMGLFEKYDVDGSDTIEYKEFADGFLGLRVTAADVDATTRSVMGQLRNAIARRGGLNGIRSLGRVFRILDDSGNRVLTRDEVKFGLLDFGLDFSDSKMEMVLDAFDRNGDGMICFDEFLRGLRGKMNKQRRELVLLAFNVVDTDGSGVLTVEDLADCYDTSMHPDVIDGSATPTDVLNEFMSQWDTVKRDGMVTKEEFIEYYADVSASIDNDDYFELMIRNAWHISGGEGWAENTSNLRVLVTFIDGTEEVVEIENDIGVRRDDMTQIKLRLHKQGYDVRTIRSVSTSM